MSRLSIDTTKSLRIAHAVLMVAASSVSADSVERFFLAPIWLCGSRACSSAVSAIWSAITFSKILLRVLSLYIRKNLRLIPSFRLII